MAATRIENTQQMGKLDLLIEFEVSLCATTRTAKVIATVCDAGAGAGVGVGAAGTAATTATIISSRMTATT